MPHTLAHGIVFKRTESPDIETTSDLFDKAIIVMKGDGTHDWLLHNDVTSNVILTTTVTESLKQLSAGVGDYALVPRLVGLLKMRELDISGIERTGPLIDAYGRGRGFAVKDGNQELLAKLNSGLDIVKATGRYDDIYDKWFGIIDPRGVPNEVILRYSAIAAGGVVLLGVLVVVWIVTLKRLVRRQTAALQNAYDDVEKKVEERGLELVASEGTETPDHRNGARSHLAQGRRGALSCLQSGSSSASSAPRKRKLSERPTTILLTASWPTSFSRRDRAAMEAGGPTTNEETITFADDGHTAMQETTKTSLKDRDGNVIGCPWHRTRYYGSKTGPRRVGGTGEDS